MTRLALVASASLYALIVAVAAYRASRRRVRVCMTCGRITCSGCSYKAPPGGPVI